MRGFILQNDVTRFTRSGSPRKQQLNWQWLGLFVDHSNAHSHTRVQIPSENQSLGLASMNDALVRLQNYSMTNERHTLVLDVIQEHEQLLEQVNQKLELARIRKEAAQVETERARRRLAAAETVESIAMDAFNALQKTKNDVENVLSAQAALLRPVLRLPSDILSEIFAHSQSHCQSDGNHLMNMKNNIRLSSVCRAWRTTACSSGRLWSDIYLDPFDGDELRVIDTFLKRANTCLNLCVDGRFWDQTNGASLGFWLTDFPFWRVQRLWINLEHSYTQNGLVMWPLEMQSVIHLVIYTNEACEEVHGDVLRSFPSLQSLELAGVYLQFQTFFPLPKLTMIGWAIYGIRADDPHSLANLMKCAPNLESLSFEGSTVFEIDLPLAEVAFPPLDALIQLEFPFPRLNASIHALLRSDVQLPSIQHLLLSWDRSPIAVDSGLFVRYRSATALNKLTIRLSHNLDDNDTEKNLASFQHLQHVAHLLIEAPDFSRDKNSEYIQQFIVRLSNFLSNELGFPRLQQIGFAGYIWPPITALIQLTSARRRASLSCSDTISCIQSFTFDCVEPLTVEERCRLDAAIGDCA